jgi:hypothetical protein
LYPAAPLLTGDQLNWASYDQAGVEEQHKAIIATPTEFTSLFGRQRRTPTPSTKKHAAHSRLRWRHHECAHRWMGQC